MVAFFQKKTKFWNLMIFVAFLRFINNGRIKISDNFAMNQLMGAQLSALFGVHYKPYKDVHTIEWLQQAFFLSSF